MTETKEEATVDPVSFVLTSGADFSATKEVSAALGIIADLDSAPATDDEAAKLKEVLGPFPPELVRVPLAGRMRQLGGFSLRFTGVMKSVNFDGTNATTTCTASYGGGSAADAGPMAIVNFPDFLSPIAERGKVGFEVTIKTLMPTGKAPAWWAPPTVGGWVETLMHELCQHAEPDVDAVLVYRAGTRWPYQLQEAQHWMFVYRGLPRYLLWLRRLSTGPRQELVADVVASLRKWAEGLTKQPRSVVNTLDGKPDISHLRELAPLLRLDPPSEDGNNAKLIDGAQEMLRDIAKKSSLWWLPS